MSEQRRRQRSERGVAAVEMAFVAIPLLILVFGIITYGYMMSFRGALSQAAAEGARAGAVASQSLAESEAENAVEDAVNAYGKGGLTCNSGGLTCDVDREDCEYNATRTCITVTVSYDYRNFPLLPAPPLLNFTYKTLSFSSTAEVNCSGGATSCT